MNVYLIGECVQSTLDAEITGKIVGHTIYQDRLMYVVDLDNGFWNEGRTMFTSIVVWDKSSFRVDG